MVSFKSEHTVKKPEVNSLKWKGLEMATNEFVSPLYIVSEHHRWYLKAVYAHQLADFSLVEQFTYFHLNLCPKPTKHKKNIDKQHLFDEESFSSGPRDA